MTNIIFYTFARQNQKTKLLKFILLHDKIKKTKLLK